jgi:hypothetical protein
LDANSKRESKTKNLGKALLNPFFHKKGSGATICWQSRIDVLPFNKFNIGKGSTIEDYCTVNNGVGDVIIGNNTRLE